MKLILMRHAKSDWTTNADNDFNRPLNKRGKKSAVLMGKWLSDHGFLPDRILSSPAKRAQETACSVIEEIKKDKTSITWDTSIYAAELDDLLYLVKKYYESSDQLLLIGHNPGLDELLLYLAREEPQTSSSGKLLTTAAIAVLILPEKMPGNLEHCAEIMQVIRPGEIMHH